MSLYCHTAEVLDRLVITLSSAEQDEVDQKAIAPASRWVDQRLGLRTPLPGRIAPAVLTALGRWTIDWENRWTSSDGEVMADCEATGYDRQAAGVLTGLELLVGGSKATWRVRSQSGLRLTLQPLYSAADADAVYSLYPYRSYGYGSRGGWLPEAYVPTAAAYDARRVPILWGTPSGPAEAAVWAATQRTQERQGRADNKDAKYSLMRALGLLGISQEGQFSPLAPWTGWPQW